MIEFWVVWCLVAHWNVLSQSALHEWATAPKNMYYPYLSSNLAYIIRVGFVCQVWGCAALWALKPCYFSSLELTFPSVEPVSVIKTWQLPTVKQKLLNSLSPNSDKYLISPHNITTWSNVQVMRMKGIIIKDKMSCLIFVQILPTSTIRNVLRTVGVGGGDKMHTDIETLKG